MKPGAAFQFTYRVIDPARKVPEGTFEIKSSSVPSNQDVRQALQRWLIHQGVCASRRNPQEVRLLVTRLRIEGDKIKADNAVEFYVMPQLSRMTEKEYQEEHEALLSRLPAAFQGFASSHAYEEGHSAGYEEVILLLHNLVDALEPAIENYRRQLMAGVVQSTPAG